MPAYESALFTPEINGKVSADVVNFDPVNELAHNRRKSGSSGQVEVINETASWGGMNVDQCVASVLCPLRPRVLYSYNRTHRR